MRLAASLALLASALAAQEPELEFEKDPVECKSIEFEVRVPIGFKVQQDKTGLSAEGKEGGLVITREPALEEEKEFDKSWQRVLSAAGIAAQVKKARAGRYPAFHARWESKSVPNRVVDVYRVYVDDLEMLYNISFSTPKGSKAEGLIEGVLKSFKVTGKAPKVELQKSPVDVGQAGKIQIPVGCVAEKAGQFDRSIIYRKWLPGYEKPKIAVSIRLESVPAQYRLQTGGTTSDPEAVNRWFLQQFGLANAKWESKPRSKPATYDGLKGEALTGRIRDENGEMLEVYLWTGKGKNHSPTILIIAHERELRLDKKYFRTILKSFEAAK